MRVGFRPANHNRYGRRRQKSDGMTRAEQRYASDLDARKLAGEVIEWHYEAITFVLASGLRYTPDFIVYLASGEVECVDTKGSGPVDDKSIAKAKMAAEKFWPFRFVMEREKTKKSGGGRERREF